MTSGIIPRMDVNMRRTASGRRTSKRRPVRRHPLRSTRPSPFEVHSHEERTAGNKTRRQRSMPSVRMVSLPHLTGKDRRRLRGMAHHMKPVVIVGGNGITKAVVRAVDEALTARQLIKVRFHEPEDKKAMAQDLARRAGALLIGLVGHTAILYRPRPDEK